MSVVLLSRAAAAATFSYSLHDNEKLVCFFGMGMLVQHNVLIES
jgi:hypothetical protein